MNLKIIIFPVTFTILLLISACGQETSETIRADNENSAENVVPVEAMIVRSGPVSQDITLTGKLEPIHSVDIIAEVSGTVIRINKKVGDYVSPADILAVIDDEILRSNYEQSQAQVLSAETNLKIAQLNLKSDEQLFKNGDISELAHENSKLAVKTAEANYRSAVANLSLTKKMFNDTRIQSPIAGFIARKYIDIGTMVMQNMNLYRVVDLSRLKVEVGIPQELISRVKKGNPAELLITGLSHEKFSGEVKYISPQADENTGAFMTEIHVHNTPDNKIRAGMTSRIMLTLEELNSEIAVPDHAVVKKNGENYIYKIKNDHAVLSKIKIAKTFGNQVLIDSGIISEDTIVVVGMKNLGADTKVLIESIRD